MIESLRPAELARRLRAGEDLVLLDVREPEEVAIGCLDGSVTIPLGELAVRHVELDPDLPTVCICHHGIRSASAAVALERLGFDRLYNLVGGVDAWSRDVDPGLPRY